MTQPLEYYVKTNIPVIADFENEYGEELQSLSPVEKLLFIKELSADLYDAGLPTFNLRTEDLLRMCQRLSTELLEDSDVVGLLKALVNSL